MKTLAALARAFVSATASAQMAPPPAARGATGGGSPLAPAPRAQASGATGTAS